MKSKPFVLGAITLLLAIMAAAALVSQEVATDLRGSGEPLGLASGGAEDVPPLVATAAELQFGNRSIIILRSADRSRADAGNVIIYTPRPGWPLVRRPDPTPDLPDIVWGVKKNVDPEGCIRVEMKFLVWDPRLDALAKAAVLDSRGTEREVALSQGRSEDQVHIRKWPVKYALITCRVRSTGEFLAQQEAKDFAQVARELEVTFPFTAAAFARFCERAADDDVEFVVRYSYRAKTVRRVEAVTEGVLHLEQKLSSLLSQEQLAGKAPVFQRLKDEAVQYGFIQISRSIYSEDPTLIPMLTPSDFSGKVFLDISWDTLRLSTLSGDDKNALLEVLTPLVQRVQEIAKRDKVNVTLDQKREGSTTEVGGGFSYYVSFSAGHQASEDTLKAAEHTEGLTFTKVADRPQYILTNVRAYKVCQGIQNFKLADIASVALATEGMGYTTDYVRCNFTADVVLAGTKPVVDYDVSFRLVRPGTIWMGIWSGKPPEDWVYFGPPNRYPVADWVPKHLQGTEMPDPRNLMISIAGTPDEVGLPQKGGRVRSTGPVDLKNVTVPANLTGPEIFALTRPLYVFPTDGKPYGSLADGYYVRTGVKGDRCDTLGNQSGFLPVNDSRGGFPISYSKVTEQRLPNPNGTAVQGSASAKTEGSLDGADALPQRFPLVMLIKMR